MCFSLKVIHETSWQLFFTDVYPLLLSLSKTSMRRYKSAHLLYQCYPSFTPLFPSILPPRFWIILWDFYFFLKSIMFFKKDLIVLILYFLQLISNTSFAVVNGILKLPNYSARGDKVIGNIIQRNMKITGIRRFTLKSLNGQNISVTLNNQLKVRFWCWDALFCNIITSTKICLLSTCVVPVILHGCTCWTMFNEIIA